MKIRKNASDAGLAAALEARIREIDKQRAPHLERVAERHYDTHAKFAAELLFRHRCDLEDVVAFLKERASRKGTSDPEK